MRIVATSSDRISARVDGGVGWLVLDNPTRHNALTADMFAALREVLAAWDADSEVRVVVVRGAGERAFASGADIGKIDQLLPKRGGDPPPPPPAATWRRGALASERPVIAMIHGYCMGGGLLVAMDADLRIAADDAQFSIPAGKLGAGYPYEAVAALVGLVGPGAAAEILFTAERFDAVEAARIGLVDRVVPKAELESRVRSIAEAIASNAPLTIAAAKAAIRSVAAGSRSGDVQRARATIDACRVSEDFAEGRRAFLERRPPTFRGR